MGLSRKLRLEAAERWPTLTNFLGCYLHQDWPLHDGTPEAAIDHAIADHNLEDRQLVAREWWDWNAKVGSKNDPRREVNDGLGVNVRFKTPEEARALMNLIYDKLIVSIRAEAKGWKP